ncbi:MAG: DUF2723 domain-containing protein [Ignavibacteriaceae bacterium]|jgi:hypothetical protein
MMINFLKKSYGVLAGGLVFILYLFTLAPTVIQLDAGELTTVQALLGIAHPTGYPLFTMLGHLFLLLPLHFSVVYRANLLAALWTAGSASVFIYTVKLVIDNIVLFKTKKNDDEKKKNGKQKKEKKISTVLPQRIIIPELVKYLSALLGGLLLATSKTFWSQSTSVEVYSLHLFFISVIIYTLLLAFIKSNNVETPKHFYWYFLAIALAFGFSNHMTTILILPGIAYLYFRTFGFNFASFKRVAIMLAIFFPLLISFYAYLPLRAAQNPTLNWGNPIDLERILRHISGKQYQVWLFSSTEAAKKQLAYFIENFPAEFNIGLILAFIGFFSAFVHGKKFFLFTLLTFLTTVLYSINYDINDIDSYFLLAYICVAFFVAFGVMQIFLMLKDRHLGYSLPIPLLIIFLLVQSYISFGKVDQHDVYLFEDYTKSALQSCKQQALIMSYQWDFLVSPAYYVQKVENFRPDVHIVDKELLRRSWYFNQLNKNDSSIISGITPTINQFKEALVPFERGGEFDPVLLESLYQKLLKGLIETNIDKRPVYLGAELVMNEMQKGEFKLPEGYTLVPDIFFFKVVKTNKYVPADNPNFHLRFPKQKNYYVTFVEDMVGSMLVRRALYEMQFDNRERAKVYIKKLKEELPYFAIPAGLAEVIEK